MDVINRLKSQVSQALPGNPITKDFEISAQSCLCGHGLLWKVFDAKSKSTKQDASVWIFEKKLIDKLNKSAREDVIQLFKKGVTNLTKLRHPKILSVVHPLEESRESLAFATEPVYASLSNVLIPDVNLPQNVLSEIREHKLFDVEIKHGILQICEALIFLHNDCKQFHLNICPENIIIIKNGSWKLAGFDFSIGMSMINRNNESNASARDISGEQVISVAEWQSSYCHIAQTKLNFSSPETTLQGRAVSGSDMFSLGMLMFAIHNDGKPLYDCKDDIITYRKNSSELNNIRLSQLQCLPESVREHIKLLLKFEGSLRPDAHQMTKIPYFIDNGVSILQSLDNLYQLDNLARSQFYKSLPKSVMVMPKRINLYRILPQLTEEFNNNNMVPFVLPTVLQIADLCTEVEFSRSLLPKLIPAFLMSEPIQITLIFLQNLNILMSKCPESEFKVYILPMINRALEVDNKQTQDYCLKILPTIAHLMTYSTLKNAIVPRLKKLCLSATTNDMKVSCLMCLAKLMEYTDKWFVIESILPLLPDVKSREPAVLMSCLGIYQKAFSHEKLGITKENIATDALPFLLPMSIDSNLNLNQYTAFMNLIQQMIARIDTEHRSKLEQLNGLQQEYKSIPLSGTNNENSVKEIKSSDKILMNEVEDVFGFTDTSRTVAPQTLVQYNSVSGAAASNRSGLSLEEKQRIATQQEQYSRMSNQLKDQNVATPKTVDLTKKTVPIKDLTSTLMDRNLAIMSNTKSNPQGSNYNIGSFSNGMNSSYTSPNQQFIVPKEQPRPVINTAAFNGLNPFDSSSRPTLNQLGSSNLNNIRIGQPPVMYPIRPLQQNLPMTSINNQAKVTSLGLADIDDLLK